MMELGDALFDEYLPKVKKKDRVQFLNELLNELVAHDTLQVEDDIPEGDSDSDELSFDGGFSTESY